MKILKKISLFILAFAIAVFCFRGFLFRNLITYQFIGTRQSYTAYQDLIKYIEKNNESKTAIDVREIIQQALSITSKKLNFTFDKSDTDPNLILKSKNAHCVGYAAFFTTTCNYLLEKNRLSDFWIAKSQVGQLYLLGINVHKYSNSSFFQDHDFVVIENKKTGEVFAVDPSVYDYFHIDFVTVKK